MEISSLTSWLQNLGTSARNLATDAAVTVNTYKSITAKGERESPAVAPAAPVAGGALDSLRPYLPAVLVLGGGVAAVLLLRSLFKNRGGRPRKA